MVFNVLYWSSVSFKGIFESISYMEITEQTLELMIWIPVFSFVTVLVIRLVKVIIKGK